MSTEAHVANRLAKAKLKFENELSQTIPPPWDHQLKTLELGKQTPVVFDTSDPGTGKTRGHIDMFTWRAAKGETEKALILCPKTLMAAAWAADLRKFAPGVTYSIAYAENREKAFDVDAQVYILNIDGVKWLAKKTKTWMEKKFGKNATLIIDEITAFKNHNSQRSRAAKKIAKYFKYRAGLTGTPNPNSVTELWHQVLLLDDGERLGRVYTGFRNATQVPRMEGRFTKWEDKPDANMVVGYMLKDISIRHQFESVMSVPENYTRFVDYEMPPKLWKQYEQLKEQAILELEEGDVTAVNAAVLANKLLQLTSGAVYGEDGVPRILDDSRYELVSDLVAERDHSVVFFSWKHQRDCLVQMAKSRGIEYEVIDGTVSNARRNEIVEEYQEGKLQAIYLHPRTGAHGLTLTRGRATIWASPRYEADFLKQGIHRVYRGGQTKKTENINVRAVGTMETSVYDKQGSKFERMTDLLAILKGNNDKSS